MVSPLIENVPFSSLITSTVEPDVPSGMLSAGGTTYSDEKLPSSLMETVYWLPFSAVIAMPPVGWDAHVQDWQRICGYMRSVIPSEVNLD